MAEEIAPESKRDSESLRKGSRYPRLQASNSALPGILPVESIAAVSKTVRRVTLVSWLRIPPSPLVAVKT